MKRIRDATAEELNEAFRSATVAAGLSNENARLRAAIKWALGEAPDENGKWFGEDRPALEARYWWRTQLRAALNQQSVMEK